jgi:K+-transporting ATPase KdpF subunit
MRSPSTGCEGTTMDPIFGLIVALALGIYLLVTLIRPERF